MSGDVKGSADTAGTAPAAPVSTTDAAERTAVASARLCGVLVAARQQAERISAARVQPDTYAQYVPWIADVHDLLRPLLQWHAPTGAGARAVFPHIAVSAADVDSTRWYGAAALCVDLKADPHPLCVWACLMSDPTFASLPDILHNEDTIVPFVRGPTTAAAASASAAGATGTAEFGSGADADADPFPCDTLLSQLLELLYRTGAREWMLNAHNRKSVLATLSIDSVYGRACAVLRLSMAAERYDVPCDAEWATACRDALAELMTTYDPGDVDAECNDFVSHAPVATLLLDAPLSAAAQEKASGATTLLALAVVRGHTGLVRAMLQRAPTAVLLFRGLTPAQVRAIEGSAPALAAVAEMDVMRSLVLAKRRAAIVAALAPDLQPLAAAAAADAALPGALPGAESAGARNPHANAAVNAASERMALPVASDAVSVGLLQHDLMALLLAYVGDTP